jgi:hypothetical protein
MKTSSTPAAPDRSSAWAWTLTNLLVLPGLGSLAAGRQVGWAQAGVALAGLGLIVYGLTRLIRDWLAAGLEPVFEFTPALGSLLAGLGISAVAWFWALATSIQVHRALRARERAAAASASSAAPPRLEAAPPAAPPATSARPEAEQPGG